MRKGKNLKYYTVLAISVNWYLKVATNCTGLATNMVEV